jgi:hypothetical protein
MLPSWFLHDTVKTSIRNCNFPPFSRSVRNREKQYYEKQLLVWNPIPWHNLWINALSVAVKDDGNSNSEKNK